MTEDSPASDEHAERVVDRATTNIASIIARHRRGDLDFASMVDAIELQISSMIGLIEPGLLEEWRSHWNRLEYVHASLIEDDRTELAADEKEMVDDALDALESLTTR